MMSMVMIYVESLIFVALSVLHLYWAFGGQWGFEMSLPTNEQGEKVLNPKKKDSWIVGIGLLFFATFYLLKSENIALEIPGWIMLIAGWLIPVIFILRAMGDFRYIGFFKKIKETDFGIRDSRFYSPLCLIIGLNGILIQLNIY